jgi:hypothetical protein
MVIGVSKSQRVEKNYTESGAVFHFRAQFSGFAGVQENKSGKWGCRNKLSPLIFQGLPEFSNYGKTTPATPQCRSAVVAVLPLGVRHTAARRQSTALNNPHAESKNPRARARAYKENQDDTP